jgi:hypothetical protein
LSVTALVAEHTVNLVKIKKKKDFIKDMLKINGSMDLNEIYISCIEHTYVHAQKYLFS